MKWTVVVLCLLLGEGCFAFTDWDQYHIVWQDEFDYLDRGKWQHEVTAAGGGNNEFQLYTQDSKNSFVRDGKLYIKPSLLADNINPKTNRPYGTIFMNSGVLNVSDNYGTCTYTDNDGCYRTGAARNIPPVMSARLRTAQKFNFTYGRVEVRAKMPVGDWLWPAIWLLPENWVYGGWPRSGEIDIIESIGNRDFKDRNGGFVGIQKMASTVIFGPAWDDAKIISLAKVENSWNYGDNFHTFYFDWSPNGLRFFIDNEHQALLDVPYPLIDKNPQWVNFWEWQKPWKPENTNPWVGGTNMAPFDQAFHFLLNVAVGGRAIPDGYVNRGGDPALQKPWSNGDSYVTAMLKFYNARGNWKGTWDGEGDNNAMQVDYIRVYKRI